MAALPLALFVLFCAFEPWLLIVCALCGWGLVHPNLFPLKESFVLGCTFALTVLCSLFTRRFYQRLYLRGKLTTLLRYQARVKAVIVGVLGFALLLSYAGYKDVTKRNSLSASDYESPFSNVSPDGLPISAQDIHYYDLPPFVYGHGLLDTQRLWQAHVPRAQMARFVAASGMRRVPETAFSSHFWDKPPYWWQRPQGKVEAYKFDDFSENKINGLRNEAAVYDPQTETVFLWEQRLDWE